jgi:hypothetical protein
MIALSGFERTAVLVTVIAIGLAYTSKRHQYSVPEKSLCADTAADRESGLQGLSARTARAGTITAGISMNDSKGGPSEVPVCMVATSKDMPPRAKAGENAYSTTKN